MASCQAYLCIALRRDGLQLSGNVGSGQLWPQKRPQLLRVLLAAAQHLQAMQREAVCETQTQTDAEVELSGSAPAALHTPCCRPARAGGSYVNTLPFTVLCRLFPGRSACLQAFNRKCWCFVTSKVMAHLLGQRSQRLVQQPFHAVAATAATRCCSAAQVAAGHAAGRAVGYERGIVLCTNGRV